MANRLFHTFIGLVAACCVFTSMAQAGGTVDAGLKINIPCINVNDVFYETSLVPWSNPSDPDGYYWQLGGSVVQTSNDGDCASLDSTFAIFLPNLSVSGSLLDVTLPFYASSQNPNDLIWTLGNIAQTITGKVVGVADGDTITVLEGTTQYKIRLYGIDTPESSQDFGNSAKQFISDLVFGKQVKVVWKDIDQYDRIVGMVFVGNTSVNQEIIKAGMAWVYDYYCKDSVCPEWKLIENQAQEARIGLWSHPDPIAPWDYYRRGS